MHNYFEVFILNHLDITGSNHLFKNWATLHQEMAGDGKGVPGAGPVPSNPGGGRERVDRLIAHREGLSLEEGPSFPKMRS